MGESCRRDDGAEVATRNKKIQKSVSACCPMSLNRLNEADTRSWHDFTCIDTPCQGDKCAVEWQNGVEVSLRKKSQSSPHCDATRSILCLEHTLLCYANALVLPQVISSALQDQKITCTNSVFSDGLPTGVLDRVGAQYRWMESQSGVDNLLLEESFITIVTGVCTGRRGLSWILLVRNRASHITWGSASAGIWKHEAHSNEIIRFTRVDSEEGCVRLETRFSDWKIGAKATTSCFYGASRIWSVLTEAV